MPSIQVLMNKPFDVILRRFRRVCERAGIQRKEVGSRTKLEDSGVLQIVQKLVKQCKDAARQFQQGERPYCQTRKEKANIAILSTYLPAQLSDAEMERLMTGR